ncbi:MAG: hypothetical protein KAT41_02190, partial [Candidatus Marinimicrobia bacterium]|nr:hypothetical protein [Candidatus Neomarinimicrobiota bacterium]
MMDYILHFISGIPIGLLLGENWHKVVALISQYNRFVTLIIVSILMFFNVYHIRRKTVKLGETI